MTDSLTSSRVRFAWLLDAAVAGLFWFAWDRLAGRQLPVSLLALSALPSVLLGGTFSTVPSVRAWPAPIRFLLEVVLLGGCLFLLNLGFARLTGGQIAYAAVVVALLRGWARKGLSNAAAAVGDEGFGDESLRRAILLLSAGWITLPLFTDRLVGGVDAQWYVDVLNDFLQQFRHGVFPIFLGQGEAAFNGSVHPFRSAPYYQHLAAVADLLSLRTLGPVALAHLTVIASAAAAGIAMYSVLVRLAPLRRWPALAVAVIYISSPGFLAPFYLADQYLTFLAMAVIPLVLYGNLVVLRDGRLTGWLCIAAGLSWLWMTHPPQAVLITFATVGIQGGRLVFFGCPWEEWKKGLLGALFFLLLSAYHFLSLAQVPSPFKPSYTVMGLQLGGGCLAVAGLALGPLWRRGAWAWLMWIAGLGLLQMTRPAWMWAALAASLGAMICRRLLAARARWSPETSVWPTICGSFLLAGVLVPVVGGLKPPVENTNVVNMLSEYAAVWPSFFLPVGTAGPLGNFQPGWGVWFLALGLGWSAIAWRSSVSRALLPVLLLLAISCLKVPALTTFWSAFQPRALVAMLGFPLPNRMFPPFVALACVGGFCWLAELAARRPERFRIWGLRVPLVLALWSLIQVYPFVQFGGKQTQTASETARRMRPDNSSLGDYAYEMMMVPPYASHGKMDPYLESRLHLPQGGDIGPDETARRMEKLGATEQAIHTEVDPTAPAWLNLSPKVLVGPGERLLLRFEFLPKAYSGYLILKSAHLYREYLLPESGWAQAFGSGEKASHTFSLWNSGTETEEVKLSFQRSPPANSGDFGDFGRLLISHYRPEAAPIRTLALIPYRVEIDAPEAGWLETPRVFIPGYHAQVDGQEVEVTSSPASLARISVPAGRHQIEMAYTGTALLRVAAGISLLTWVGLLAWFFRTKADPAAGASPL